MKQFYSPYQSPIMQIELMEISYILCQSDGASVENYEETQVQDLNWN